ncbi:ZN414 protein, partial [Chauna torquata]|nr:ZN414 protein [Chauna torquata]
MQELMDHLKVHYRPTQSLEGKTFQCPTLGCMETFPSMQDLMAHMKVHYKPNRYFKLGDRGGHWLHPARSCRAWFHRLNKWEGAAAAWTQKPPLFFWAPWPGWNLPALAPQVRRGNGQGGGRAAQPCPMPTAGSAPRLEVPPPQQGGDPCVRRARSRGSYPHSLAGAEPLRSAAPHPAPRGAPTHGGSRVSAVLPSSPVLAGHSSNSRIVWEHTRGRYTCMQCPYSTASREEMTLHIEDHRKNPLPPGRLDADMDFGVGLASFHSKLTPEMENSLYSQL